MKKVLPAITVVAMVACSSANAAVIEEGAKGSGKGVKSVGGCVDRGVKGTGKGIKAVAGCADRGAKGVGKAVKTIL